MLTKRIIPCLDIKDGRTVKGVNFVQLRDAGDPVELAKIYSDEGADELRKYAALIRATFKVDPFKLNDKEFGQLAAEALYIKDLERKKMEVALMEIAQLFIPKR